MNYLYLDYFHHYIIEHRVRRKRAKWLYR